MRAARLSASIPASRRRSIRALPRAAALAGAAAAFAGATASATAQAAPAGGSAQVQVGSQGTSASSSGKGKSGKYKWPEVVVSGNAISFLAPLQFGIAGYLPKARFAFQYDRQIRKGHWFHVGVAALFDRGDYHNFRMKSCGLSGTGVCGEGGVVGVDVYAGYTYRFFLQKRPWLVPYVRGTVGYTFFDLPKVGGGDGNRRQERIHTNSFSIRPGGGLRIFPIDQLGLGMDIALPIGFLVHKQLNDAADASVKKKGAFLFGIEVLPVVVEFRF